MKTLLVVIVAFCLFVPTASAQASGFLKIQVIEGEGAFNNIRSKVGRDIEVEVRDPQDNLVQGAEVAFTLPMDGASGAFGGAERKYSTVTDVNGRAGTRGFKPNSVEGRFNIKVNASYHGREGQAIVSQSNTLAGGVTANQHGNKKVAIISLLAGGAVGGAVLATRLGGKGSSSVAPPPAISLSVGGISVGSPQH
jgi:hypothetical protein